MSANRSDKESAAQREVEYLSATAEVSMADRWFEIAAIDHFWIRRRFEVLQRLAGSVVAGAKEMAEIGCGHGLLQRQIEDGYGREVSGFDLNEYALKRSVSRRSKIYCYDIFQRESALRERFDLIFLFDVLEHIREEDAFMDAVLFHLAPNGKVIVNVPAGQWAFSSYDEAAGHVRRYSIDLLAATAARSGLAMEKCSYWGLPLVPILMVRKLWLMAMRDRDKIITAGFDSRSPGLDSALRILSICEAIPQRLLGTSLLAVFQRAR
jgi:2-polyprenyl-3-methyl-5-hydroxy-6-metoxy-1,4-benzoquinol methylase